MAPRAVVIAIAGPSCSGKTTIARRLRDALGPDRAVVFELDWYYHDHSTVPKHLWQFDHPSAIDDALMVDQLRTLAAGRPIDRPLYDYATHARTGATARVEPAPFVIVEGLFALYWEGVRALADVAVFITADHGLCLARRIERDVRERGRTAESVIRQVREQVEPMYEAHVHPTRRHAHLLVDGARPVDEILPDILALVPEKRRGK